MSTADDEQSIHDNLERIAQHGEEWRRMVAERDTEITRLRAEVAAMQQRLAVEDFSVCERIDSALKRALAAEEARQKDWEARRAAEVKVARLTAALEAARGQLADAHRVLDTGHARESCDGTACYICRARRLLRRGLTEPQSTQSAATAMPQSGSGWKVVTEEEPPHSDWDWVWGFWSESGNVCSVQRGPRGWQRMGSGGWVRVVPPDMYHPMTAPAVPLPPAKEENDE